MREILSLLKIIWCGTAQIFYRYDRYIVPLPPWPRNAPFPIHIVNCWPTAPTEAARLSVVARLFGSQAERVYF